MSTIACMSCSGIRTSTRFTVVRRSIPSTMQFTWGWRWCAQSPCYNWPGTSVAQCWTWFVHVQLHAESFRLKRSIEFPRNDQQHFYGGRVPVLARGAELPLLQRAQHEARVTEAPRKREGQGFK